MPVLESNSLYSDIIISAAWKVFPATSSCVFAFKDASPRVPSALRGSLSMDPMDKSARACTLRIIVIRKQDETFKLIVYTFNRVFEAH